MQAQQSYISKELTHFLGRHLQTEDEQYNLLLTILRTGKLLSSPKVNIPEYTKREFTIGFPKTNISSNEGISANIVCLCDIPLGDLKHHMAKYSKFGLSFLKSNLINKGANPVFYISSGTVVKGMKMANIFDANVSDYINTISLRLHRVLKSALKDDFMKLIDIKKLENINSFIIEVFSYVKFFDASLNDNDPNNYYMEREWRVIGDINFNTSEVFRVILPTKYAQQLKLDVPDFKGQISFSYL